jgi:hypothetical protein
VTLKDLPAAKNGFQTYFVVVEDEGRRKRRQKDHQITAGFFSLEKRRCKQKHKPIFAYPTSI